MFIKTFSDFPLLGMPETYSQDVVISTSTGPNQATQIWSIIALILAIVGGILTYFLFVKTKEDPKNKFLAWLKNFLAFKTMWIEPILKVVYYVETIFVVLLSFAFISESFLTFLAVLIIGPIAVRLVYELLMMLIMIWHNSQIIADNSKKK